MNQTEQKIASLCNKKCLCLDDYFLIRGNEKVILSLEKICDNKMLVFTKKDINYQDKLMYTCQVNSKNNNYSRACSYCLQYRFK